MILVKSKYFRIVLAILMIVPMMTASVLAQGWSINQVVGLPQGKLIRPGPGIPAHTCVRVDNWLVMVIGGPRYEYGEVWYDISRAAVGDPSGGTGWVTYGSSDIVNCDEWENGGGGGGDDGGGEVNTWEPTNTDYLYLSQIAYAFDPDDSHDSSALLEELNERGWDILSKATSDGQDDVFGFYAVAFRHDYTQQVAIAHRGTNIQFNGFGNGYRSIQDIATDIGIAIGEVPPQLYSAIVFTASVRQQMEINNISSYRIVHTGHSLGGALAEAMAACDGGSTQAIAFDSPGGRVMAALGCGGNASNAGNFVAGPNLVNTVQGHVGSMVLIDPGWYYSERRTRHDIPGQLASLRENLWNVFRELFGPTFWSFGDFQLDLSILEDFGEVLQTFLNLPQNYVDYSLEEHSLDEIFLGGFDTSDDPTSDGTPASSSNVSQPSSFPQGLLSGFANFIFPMESCYSLKCDEVRALTGNPFGVFSGASAHTSVTVLDTSAVDGSETFVDVLQSLIPFMQPTTPLARDVVVDIHVIGDDYTNTLNAIADWLETTSASRVKVISGDTIIIPFTDSAAVLRLAAQDAIAFSSDVSLRTIISQMNSTSYRTNSPKDWLIVVYELPVDFTSISVDTLQQQAFAAGPVNINSLVVSNDITVQDAYRLIAHGSWGQINFATPSTDLYDATYDLLDDVLKVIEVPVGLVQGGSNANVINLGSNGTAPVYVLGRSRVPVRNIDPGSLTLSGMSVQIIGNGRYNVQYRDVNGDNVEDAVFHFLTNTYRPEWVINETLYFEGLLSDETIVGHMPLRIVGNNDQTPTVAPSKPTWAIVNSASLVWYYDPDAQGYILVIYDEQGIPTTTAIDSAMCTDICTVELRDMPPGAYQAFLRARNTVGQSEFAETSFYVDGLIAVVDSDADGIDDSFDNCTVVANADQLDRDGDGIGAACDMNDSPNTMPIVGSDDNTVPNDSTRGLPGAPRNP